MGSLGELERLIMDILWDSNEPLAANDLRDRLKDPSMATRKSLATTTILTVLSRLETKDFVSRDRSQRPHLYRADLSRADHTARLMHQVLGSVPDRQAALARFIGNITPQEAETMRRLLGEISTGSSR
ncbi:MAG: BlaI/MecI/CopY family transcriptional regulator [Cryobacterium sp.]